MAVAQSGQKVHSKLQMRASPCLGVGALHFSHSAFISSMGKALGQALNWLLHR
jgi:hypothetical protein